MVATDLQLTKTTMEYFHDRVSEARESLRVDLDQTIEFYLVNLLCDFVHPARLDAVLTDQDVLDTPLALLLKRAMECPPSVQLKAFKRLGDVSLYVAGFFQDYFNRKSFDLDYYITMGTTAYTSVSAIMRDRHHDEHFTSVYRDLATQFAILVEVVAEVADSPERLSTLDLLAIYDRWARSHSGRLQRVLERFGIVPVPTSLKRAQ